MNIIVKVKKIGIILLATLIFFTGTFIFPLTEQKAHAFPLAVPAGVQIGAGVYVTGALITAGAAGLIGYDEHSEAINAHAKGVWDGATQVSKDSIDFMVNGAVGLGNALTNVDEPFGEWIESKLDDIALAIAGMGNEEVMSTYFKNTGSAIQFNTVRVTFGGSSDGSNHGYFFTQSGADVRIEWRASSGSRSVYVSGDVTTIQNSFKGLNSLAAWLSWHNKYFGHRTAWKMAIGLSSTAPAVQETYNTAASQTREAWEGMKDAGLVLPVDSATAYVGNDVVKHNPADDTYTTDAGAVYSPSDVTWSFPTVIPRTDGVPVPGLYTDSPALTGNPAIDEAIVNNPAIPKTTTNINTGVTTSNPDYVGEGNPPLEGGVPPTNPPPSKWEKPPTKKPPNIGALVTTKFPFSLPWDFFGVLGWINAEPKAPVFKLDTGLNTPFGKELKMDMEFKFNFLDPYMGYFRGFIIIGFSLFLILATRRLMGGAG